MGAKPRPSVDTELFVHPSGDGWSIRAQELFLIERSKRSRFKDYRSLVGEAARRIRAREKRGFRLAGGLAARAAGTHNQVTPDHIEVVRKLFGPRRSLWADAWTELANVLETPSGYQGGVLIIDGDVTISGSWDAGGYAAVVVLGNCTVEGLLYQYQTEPWFVVTGDLAVDNLVMAGNLDVGGSIRARGSAEFESSDGYAHAGGDITSPILFVWDMPVTCESVLTDLYVSRVGFGDRVNCRQAKIGHHLEALCGADLTERFHPCVLDYHGVDDPASDPDLPELSLEQSRVIHLLGLPIGLG